MLRLVIGSLLSGSAELDAAGLRSLTKEGAQLARALRGRAAELNPFVEYGFVSFRHAVALLPTVGRKFSGAGAMLLVVARTVDR